MAENDIYKNWQARDWQHMHEVWRELVGPVNTDAEEYSPTFKGSNITLQQAGYVFENWIIQGFRLNGSDIDPPFSVSINPGADERPSHQLDGLLFTDSREFLVESKFTQVDFTPIARLHLLVESRPIGTMGILFAARGFTIPAIDLAHIQRPIRVLLFNRQELEYALQANDFLGAVRLKLRRAVKYGRSSINISTTSAIGADNG